jgi:hypothetical protein
LRAGHLAADIRHYAAMRRAILRLELLGGLCALLGLVCGLGAVLLLIAPEHRALALAMIAALLALASIALFASARARRRRRNPLGGSLHETLADLAAVVAAARAVDPSPQHPQAATAEEPRPPS